MFCVEIGSNALVGSSSSKTFQNTEYNQKNSIYWPTESRFSKCVKKNWRHENTMQRNGNCEEFLHISIGITSGSLARVLASATL
jgi:hypothetical protein